VLCEAELDGAGGADAAGTAVCAVRKGRQQKHRSADKTQKADKTEKAGKWEDRVFGIN
jgi:hypothetical protein